MTEIGTSVKEQKLTKQRADVRCRRLVAAAARTHLAPRFSALPSRNNVNRD